MLSAGFSRMIGVEKWYWYGAFAFFATLGVYNGQRLFKMGKQQTPWLSWVKRHKKGLYILVAFSLMAASICVLIFQRFGIFAYVLLGISGLISLFYVIRIHGRNMREIPHIKIHLIAFSWTSILILFPALNEQLGHQIWLPGIAHYIYVLAVTIPFDIRDLKYDTPSQKTIPQIIGVVPSVVLASALMGVFAGMMLVLIPEMRTSPMFYAAVAVQLPLIIGSNERRSDVYYAGGIDGAIFLLGLAYLLA